MIINNQITEGWFLGQPCIIGVLIFMHKTANKTSRLVSKCLFNSMTLANQKKNYKLIKQNILWFGMLLRSKSRLFSFTEATTENHISGGLKNSFNHERK